MNSFRNVQKAIDFEIIRQIDLIESGEEIQQETRTYDAAKNITIGLRSKKMLTTATSLNRFSSCYCTAKLREQCA